MSKIKNYFSETYEEMVHHVSWPTWKELQSNTIIVVVATVIFTTLIFCMDFLFGITPGDDKSFWRGALGFIYKFL